MYLRPRQGRKPSVMNSRRELSDSDSDDSSPPNKKKKTKGGRFVNRQTGKKPLDGVNSSGKGKSLRQNAPHPPAPFLSDEKVDLSDDDNKDADHVNPSTSFGRRGLKKFRCDICGRCCASKQKIAQHMNTHTGARPFKCDQCPVAYSSDGALYNHRQTHLPPEFKCYFCPKMFVQKQNRDDHMNIHTGAKPFECEQCDETFACLSNLDTGTGRDTIQMHVITNAKLVRNCSRQAVIYGHTFGTHIRHRNSSDHFASRNSPDQAAACNTGTEVKEESFHVKCV